MSVLNMIITNHYDKCDKQYGYNTIMIDLTELPGISLAYSFRVLWIFVVPRILKTKKTLQKPPNKNQLLALPESN